MEPAEPPPRCGSQYAGSLLGNNFIDQPLWKRLDWKHVIGLGLTPLIALIGILTVKLRWQTLAFSVAYYFATGLGITAGACHAAPARGGAVGIIPWRRGAWVGMAAT